MATYSSVLKRFTWPYTFALGSGLTALGRRLRERAAELGLSLRFSRGDIWVIAGNTEVAVAPNYAIQLWCDMPRWPDLLKRIELTPQGKVLRGRLEIPGRYRIPGSPDWVWLPTLPEAGDFLIGYLAKAEPAPGDVVFDAGAYCGETAIVLARKVGPTGRVIAFEPDQKNLVWLRRNLAEAGITNVTIIESGLWHETTRLRFAQLGNYGSCLLGPSEPDMPEITVVPVVSFAEACRLAGAVPSFVKMDIEGAEIEVIAGAKDLIRANRIHFAIASYHPRDGGKTCDLLEPMFRELGYHAETGNPAHLTTWAWPAS